MRAGEPDGTRFWDGSDTRVTSLNMSHPSCRDQDFASFLKITTFYATLLPWHPYSKQTHSILPLSCASIYRRCDGEWWWMIHRMHDLNESRMQPFTPVFRAVRLRFNSQCLHFLNVIFVTICQGVPFCPSVTSLKLDIPVYAAVPHLSHLNCFLWEVHSWSHHTIPSNKPFHP